MKVLVNTYMRSGYSCADIALGTLGHKWGWVMRTVKSKTIRQKHR